MSNEFSQSRNFKVHERNRTRPRFLLSTSSGSNSPLNLRARSLAVEKRDSDNDRLGRVCGQWSTNSLEICRVGVSRTSWLEHCQDQACTWREPIILIVRSLPPERTLDSRALFNPTSCGRAYCMAR
jgi:hypothetical protein